MKMLEGGPAVRSGVTKSVETGAAEDEGLATLIDARKPSRDAWETLIDRHLISWGCDPNQLADEGVEPPPRHVVHKASLLARALRDKGIDAPTRIVPTGDGGIVFERRASSTIETIEIDADGSIEYMKFIDARLTLRTTLVLDESST